MKVSKKTLRQRMIAQRNTLDASYRLKITAEICSHIGDIISYRNPNVIHSFLPINSEINIIPVLEQVMKRDLTIVVSKALKNGRLEHLILKNMEHLKEGIYGTSYPGYAETYDRSYDIILVPGLGFDLEGNRLGYGRGYYDRFLSQHPEAYKIGIGFPFQLLETIPVEHHDIPMDLVVCG